MINGKSTNSMNNKIYLNKEIFIDLQKLVVSKLLAVANSGGGKSWLIRRIVEQAFGKVQIIIIDPEGEFSTLREKFDFILCGKGMDAPAEPRSAALLAHKLLESKASAVIDLYELHPQERKRFVRLFLESMVNAPKNLYNDCLVILDEAHKFAPEKEESESTSAVIEMASLGRKRGFCLIPVTQRVSKLSKDVAAECNNKLMGRASLDLDRKRTADELGISNKEEILALRNLEPGEFFAFGPALSNEVIRLKVGEVKTSIPKAGRQTKVAPPSERIKKELAALADLPQEAQQEARTVAELKNENRLLKQKLSKSPDQVIKNDPEVILREVRIAEKRKDNEIKSTLDANNRKILGLEKIIRDIARIVGSTSIHIENVKTNVPQQIFKPGVVTQVEPSFVKKPDLNISSEGISFGKGERAILIACAQHDGCTREHLTVLTGYKRSSRDAYIQRLQSRGYVRAGNGKINTTSEGIEALGSDYSPLPVGQELQEHLMNTLPEGEKKILAILIREYPESVDRERLSEETGYQRSSRDAYLQRLNSRQLICQEGRGIVRASDKLF